MDNHVLFEQKNQVGVITLNAPKSLNSLTMEMCQQMARRLEIWAKDFQIQCVIIESNSPKALCAGGDVVSLYRSIVKKENYHCNFFQHEYYLDLMIHQYSKPIVVLANGIVMGGGIGITNGASHRVVTETTRMAMPEITIGFFPDVGGSYFLGRMPGYLGRFLGLTGARFNATDALYAKMADYFIGSEYLEALKEDLYAEPNVDDVLTRYHRNSRALRQTPQLGPQIDLINELMGGESILEIKEKVQNFKTDDKWLQRTLATFLSGSPTSMTVTFEQIQRAKGKTLPEVFAMEEKMARNFGNGHDMAEGIRALLIDKDNNPQWKPKTLEEVTPQLVESHFA